MLLFRITFSRIDNAISDTLISVCEYHCTTLLEMMFVIIVMRQIVALGFIEIPSDSFNRSSETRSNQRELCRGAYVTRANVTTLNVSRI